MNHINSTLKVESKALKDILDREKFKWIYLDFKHSWSGIELLSYYFIVSWSHNHSNCIFKWFHLAISDWQEERFVNLEINELMIS